MVYASAINPQANEFYKQAEASFKNRDLPSAEKKLIEALKLEPDNANYRYILAQVQFMMNNFIESKNNMEIVSHSKTSQEKGDEYNTKLKNYKKKIKDLQPKFNAAGESQFNIYEKNINSPQKLKLAVTLYRAFRLNPPLRYKNIKLLESITNEYEKNLQKSIEGSEWKNEPMLQLAFLYEIANKKDKAAEVYMRALDYIKDPNEEFVITHKFDYLNRSNKEKLLDTIKAGDFSYKDIKEILGHDREVVSEEEEKQWDKIASEIKTMAEEAENKEDEDGLMENVKKMILEKHKKGELPNQKAIEDRLKKEGKTVDDLIKEGGF